MFKYLLLFVSLFVFYNADSASDGLGYQVFKNVKLNSNANTVNCFAQDSLGLIWIGSSSGLYSYDGHSVNEMTSMDYRYKTFVYSISILDSRYMAVGTGLGVWLYDYQEDKYEDFPEDGPSDVRALLRDGNRLWIGSLSGLYSYDISTRKINKHPGNQIKQFTNQTIYALAKSDRGLLIGTYNGLFELDLKSDVVRKLELSGYRQDVNQFVNSLYVNPKTGEVFIGTEFGAYVLNQETKSIVKKQFAGHLPIKSMLAYDDRTLLLGSDDGLFVYDISSDSFEKIKHDSRNPFSLANNIVWGLFRDKIGNIWIGTDIGFSIWSKWQKEQKYPIYHFSEGSDGNRFYRIVKDRQGWYWLGGDNGLIRTYNFNAKSSQWYRMGASVYVIPHNRVRDIYEDHSGGLWMASDGGVNLFDQTSKQFKTYTITDKSGKRNSNWAYNIIEDKRGNLWISSYLGGVFEVNKASLLQSPGRYIADHHYTREQGLYADFANQLIEDNRGRIWVLMFNTGVNIINPLSKKVEQVKDDKGVPLHQATYMIRDREGNIWIALHGKVLRFDPQGGTQAIVLDANKEQEIAAMEEVDGHICLAIGNSIFVLNKSSLKIQSLHYNSDISSIYYDRDTHQIILGGINEIRILPELLFAGNLHADGPIVLTGMYVNNERFGVHGYGLRYKYGFELDYNQNNLRMEFSDLSYGADLENKLAYSFKGKNEKWIVLDDNKIQLANLNSGTYHLQVAKVNAQGEVVSKIHSFEIAIAYPWYSNNWARLIYTLLFLGLLYWVYNFFAVRHKLRLERVERKSLMEVSQLKIDFLTSISHDLKTPLSLILGPVSQLMMKAKNPETRSTLAGVQNNALKINGLLEEVMEFSKLNVDDLHAHSLILSQVDLIAFAKQIISAFEVANPLLSFDVDVRDEAILIEADVAKLESILSNILSNACKYSSVNGHVLLKVEKSGANVLIKVKDNGIGISAEELPYVFSKFYRSSGKNSQVEGTGIGLYFVKNYCKQMGWTVNIESSLDIGTELIVSIPWVNVISQPVYDQIGEASCHKPQILIVEDNEELSSFLLQALREEYDCLVASDGKQALEMCESKFLPQVIISDAMMPNMGGIELARKLRKSNLTSVIPFILLTAKNDKNIERESVAAGIDVFITKPFDLEFLKLRIQQLISKKERIIEQIRLEEIQNPQIVQQESYDEKLLSSIIESIEKNMDDSDFSVQRLSEEVNVAGKQLYRKIKQLTGMTPVEYIRSIRLKQAAVLLRQKKFSVAEVMYMVGFSNASYFSKCFQAEFGVTPKAYADHVL